MKKWLLPLGLSLGLFLSPTSLPEAPQEELGPEASFQEFFDRFKGNYQIVSAGGAVPKEENKYGTVSVEEAEGLLVFPYCHKDSGVCDPGFRSFYPDSSRFFKKEISPDHIVFTLETLEKEKPRRYTWEWRNKIIYFLDKEYLLVSGEPYPLEFIAEKIPSIP